MKAVNKSVNDSDDNNSANSTTSIEYELNFYYGIHFPADMADDIQSYLKKYGGLAHERREHEYKGELIILNFTSDFEPTNCVIMADSMTTTSEPENVGETSLLFDPTELIETEKSKHKLVLYLTDMYDVIIRGLRKDKKEVKNVNLGWGAYNCVWDGDASEESSE